ncbi:unnamed protein product [Penicillium glandicola]
MNINLNQEQLSKGRAVANNWGLARLLITFAMNPRTMQDGRPNSDGRPLSKVVRLKEDGLQDLGNLRCLPNELVDMIVNKLDLPSAISLSYVNHAANAFVQKSPVTLLKRWAPELPKILKKSQIQKSWSLCELKDVIRRERCAGCGESCAQLYLPTMERICHPCMHDNHTYWCLPVEHAAMIFGLDLPDLINYQTMYLPRLSKTSDVGELGAWVIPVKLALTKALELYGTRKAIKHAVEGSPSTDEDEEPDSSKDDKFVIKNHYDIYRAAPLNLPNTVQARLLTTLAKSDIHAHHNEITYRVPVVPRGNAREFLHLCRGCTAMMTRDLESISDAQMRMMGFDPALDRYERAFVIFRRAFRGSIALGMGEVI